MLFWDSPKTAFTGSSYGWGAGGGGAGGRQISPHIFFNKIEDFRHHFDVL